MKEDNFLKILCSQTPEKINEFITASGSKKLVNGITFIKEKKDGNDNSSEIKVSD